MTKRLAVWIAAAVLVFRVVAIVAGAGDEGPRLDGGLWNVGAEHGTLQAAPGKVVFRFHWRDLHMVPSPAKTGKPVRFKVILDAAAPGENHGVDSGPNGSGEI